MPTSHNNKNASSLMMNIPKSVMMRLERKCRANSAKIRAYCNARICSFSSTLAVYAFVILYTQWSSNENESRTLLQRRTTAKIQNSCVLSCFKRQNICSVGGKTRIGFVHSCNGKLLKRDGSAPRVVRSGVGKCCS